MIAHLRPLKFNDSGQCQLDRQSEELRYAQIVKTDNLFNQSDKSDRVEGIDRTDRCKRLEVLHA